jgi:hypothetical protein
MYGYLLLFRDPQGNAGHRDKLDHGVRRDLTDLEAYKDHLVMLVCR